MPVTALNDLHFAVVIGIDRYPGLTDLTTAQRDARRFREWLVDPAGGGLLEANIREVKASDREVRIEDALPTQVEVNDAFRDVQRRVQEAIDADAEAWHRTRLYVFVAGHGFKPIEGQGALIMANATVEMLGLHIELDKYRSWYEESGLFKEVLIFADCCRKEYDCRNAYGPPFSGIRTGRQTEAAVIGYAATVGSSAYGGDGRGLFTERLLEALRGNAADRDGNVTVHQIETYVADLLGGVQTCEFVPRRNATVVVNVKPPKRDVVLSFPRGDLRVELVHGDNTSEVLEVADAEHAVALYPGIYQVCPLTPDVAQLADHGLFRIPGGEGSHHVRL